MENLNDILKEAETLTEYIARFNHEAGLVHSGLALNLWYLYRSMLVVQDEIERLVYEQEQTSGW